MNNKSLNAIEANKKPVVKRKLEEDADTPSKDRTDVKKVRLVCSTEPRRPRMTLLGSMKKPYIKTRPFKRFTIWTVTKMRAREDPSDSVEIERKDELDSFALITSAKDEKKTRDMLMRSFVARRTMSYERLQKLNEAIELWNAEFKTLYSIL